MKKIFMFDLDGTLLPHGHNQKLSYKTIEALQKLEASGHDVVINTGKAYSMVEEQLEQYSFKYTITSNGQLITDNGKEVYESSFSKEQVEYWYNYSIKHDVVLGVQGKTKQYVLASKNAMHYVNECFNDLNIPIPEIKDEVDYQDKIYQLWVLGDVPHIPDDEAYNFFRWKDNAFDIQIGSVDKGYGIEKFIEYMGYTDYELIVFGDGENDLSMFKKANISVAVANASENVQDQADYVTTSVYEDGVYEFLLQKSYI